jgi:TonB family protein
MTTPIPSHKTNLAWLLALALVAPSVAQDNVERVDSETDRKPLQTMVPDYPEAARRDRVEGEVQVCFDISRRGYPRHVAIRRSTHKVFERPALKAVRQSTWHPVEGGKELSGIKSCRTFRFYLTPVPKGERD